MTTNAPVDPAGTTSLATADPGAGATLPHPRTVDTRGSRPYSGTTRVGSARRGARMQAHDSISDRRRFIETVVGLDVEIIPSSEYQGSDSANGWLP